MQRNEEEYSVDETAAGEDRQEWIVGSVRCVYGTGKRRSTRKASLPSWCFRSGRRSSCATARSDERSCSASWVPVHGRLRNYGALFLLKVFQLNVRIRRLRGSSPGRDTPTGALIRGSKVHRLLFHRLIGILIFSVHLCRTAPSSPRPPPCILA